MQVQGHTQGLISPVHRPWCRWWPAGQALHWKEPGEFTHSCPGHARCFSHSSTSGEQRRGWLWRSGPTPPSPLHAPPSLPGLTLALRAGSTGLEARGADALEAAFCVLTAAIGAGRGATGALIHIWATGDQRG